MQLNAAQPIPPSFPLSPSPELGLRKTRGSRSHQLRKTAEIAVVASRRAAAAVVRLSVDKTQVERVFAHRTTRGNVGKEGEGGAQVVKRGE